MEVRKCTVDDIVYILENPWPITKLELETFGLLEKYSNRELAELLLEHNFGHSFVAVDMLDNPVAAFGMAVSTRTDWVCWSVRADTFPSYYKEITKIFNEKLGQQGTKQRTLDGKFERIILITSVDSRRVERWCKTIGFKKANRDDIKELYDCEVSVYVREFY